MFQQVFFLWSFWSTRKDGSVDVFNLTQTNKSISSSNKLSLNLFSVLPEQSSWSFHYIHRLDRTAIKPWWLSSLFQIATLHWGPLVLLQRMVQLSSWLLNFHQIINSHHKCYFQSSNATSTTARASCPFACGRHDRDD